MNSDSEKLAEVREAINVFEDSDNPLYRSLAYKLQALLREEGY